MADPKKGMTRKERMVISEKNRKFDINTIVVCVKVGAHFMHKGKIVDIFRGSTTRNKRLKYEVIFDDTDIRRCESIDLLWFDEAVFITQQFLNNHSILVSS